MQNQQAPVKENAGFNEDNLVFMLGEELKKPLTAIKALAENTKNPQDTKAITHEARRALRTIDNVLLYQQFTQNQLALELAPVHVGSTLAQVAAELEPLSIERGCETEVHIQSGIKTADVDSQALRSGIESLWQAVLGMTQRPSPLNWHVYQAKNGIRIAVTNNSLDLSKVSFGRGQQSVGLSRQPYAGISGPATDLITACGMFDLLGSGVSKVRKEGSSGLAVTLQPSAQLALV